MARNIKFGKSPFVTWRFVCKTPAEVKRNTKIANRTLKAFLEGFNAGIVSLRKKKHSFIIVNNVLKPLKAGSTIFLFKPVVSRKPKDGGVDAAGTKVQKPSPPSP
jgi:hypothetical protein